MDPVTGALITAGISGASSIFGNYLQANQSGQNQRLQIAANQDMFNAQSAFSQNMLQQQQNFQQFNSNTAYTRARTDMQNAGLNPMMMYGSGGSGASSPSGGLPSSPSPGAAIPGKTALGANFGDAMQNAISTANQMRLVDAQVNQIHAQTAKTAAETTTELERPLNVQSSTNVNAARSKLADLAVAPALRDAAVADAETPYYQSTAGKIAHVAGLAGRDVGAVLSPVSNLVSSARQWSGMNASRASRGLPSVGESFSDRFNPIYGRTE